MSEALTIGGIVHVMTRRLFADDLRRHFAARIQAASKYQIRAEGFAFVFQPGTNAYQSRPEKRIRIFPVTDHAGFTLDINESGPAS